MTFDKMLISSIWVVGVVAAPVATCGSRVVFGLVAMCLEAGVEILQWKRQRKPFSKEHELGPRGRARNKNQACLHVPISAVASRKRTRYCCRRNDSQGNCSLRSLSGVPQYRQ